jgi:molybdate transport system permease protein
MLSQISSSWLEPAAWQAILLSLKLALASTGVLLLLAIPLAWWLSTQKGFARPIVASLVAMPLVLPPSVLGFYLLLAMGPTGPLGLLTESLGLGLLSFTFTGLLIGSVIYSLPFAVQPLQTSFEALGPRPLEVAATLRASPLDAFWSVVLPQCRNGLLTAAILSFAHTIGEFGVVLMIGGNIPGRTQVAATQIYSHVEAMEYAQAHGLAAVLVVFSFVVLMSLSLLRTTSERLRI